MPYNGRGNIGRVRPAGIISEELERIKQQQDSLKNGMNRRTAELVRAPRGGNPPAMDTG